MPRYGEERCRTATAPSTSWSARCAPSWSRRRPGGGTSTPTSAWATGSCPNRSADGSAPRSHGRFFGRGVEDRAVEAAQHRFGGVAERRQAEQFLGAAQEREVVVVGGFLHRARGHIR